MDKFKVLPIHAIILLAFFMTLYQQRASAGQVKEQALWETCITDGVMTVENTTDENSLILRIKFDLCPAGKEYFGYNSDGELIEPARAIWEKHRAKFGESAEQVELNMIDGDGDRSVLRAYACRDSSGEISCYFSTNDETPDSLGNDKFKVVFPAGILYGLGSDDEGNADPYMQPIWIEAGFVSDTNNANKEKTSVPETEVERAPLSKTAGTPASATRNNGGDKEEGSTKASIKKGEGVDIGGEANLTDGPGLWQDCIGNRKSDNEINESRAREMLYEEGEKDKDENIRELTVSLSFCGVKDIELRNRLKDMEKEVELILATDHGKNISLKAQWCSGLYDNTDRINCGFYVDQIPETGKKIRGARIVFPPGIFLNPGSKKGTYEPHLKQESFDIDYISHEYIKMEEDDKGKKDETASKAGSNDRNTYIGPDSGVDDIWSLLMEFSSKSRITRKINLSGAGKDEDNNDGLFIDFEFGREQKQRSTEIKNGKLYTNYLSYLISGHVPTNEKPGQDNVSLRLDYTWEKYNLFKKIPTRAVFVEAYTDADATKDQKDVDYKAGIALRALFDLEQFLNITVLSPRSERVPRFSLGIEGVEPAKRSSGTVPDFFWLAKGGIEWEMNISDLATLQINGEFDYSLDENTRIKKWRKLVEYTLFMKEPETGKMEPYLKYTTGKGIPERQLFNEFTLGLLKVY